MSITAERPKAIRTLATTSRIMPYPELPDWPTPWVKELTDRELLVGAREILVKRGHAQGNFTDIDGHICMMGALMEASGVPFTMVDRPDLEMRPMLERAASLLNLLNSSNICWFNNRNDLPTILARFDESIAQLPVEA